MKTRANLERARKVRSVQADIDKRTLAIQAHKAKIVERRAELKHLRKSK